MIPNILKDYEVELKKYKRECIKIEAKSTGVQALKDSLDIKTSKFLGIPFYPKSKIYPLDTNSNPMLLAAQLNFEETPKLSDFPENGILQLFLSGTDWYDEESKIVYHSKAEMGNEFTVDFSFINQEAYEEMPILKVHQLKFKKSIENGGFEDCQFNFQFGDLDRYEFTENLNEKEEKEFDQYFDTDGHKIGGYATFTQSDPRDYKGRNKEDVQILQIDSEENIIFGDAGLGHVFISKESLINRDFDKAYFTWDCC